MKTRMTCLDVEIAVSIHFNPRRNIIVPNVSWGLNLHECDMLVLTPNGYAYEIEIKVTRGDLRADSNKGHAHINNRIARLYFAIPRELEDCIPLIPERAGVLLCSKWYAEERRPAKQNREYQFTAAERLKLAQLGTMRIWTLKRKINEHREWHTAARGLERKDSPSADPS